MIVLFSKCFWFGHDHCRTERDGAGVLQLHCETCGTTIPVLQSQTVKGPRFQQGEVLGRATGKATKVTRFETRRKTG